VQTNRPVHRELRHDDLPADDTVARRWLLALAVFVCSALFYSINSGGTPHFDELYHVLAARGLLSDGSPTIAEGVYERAYLHTWLIAQFFRGFGESLSVARLPSALAMAGTVTVLFAWLRQVAGSRAAVLGAALFALSPFAVDIAQFARFYGLQSVTFVSGSLLVYGAVESTGSGRWTRALAALVLLGVAAYFQSTSLIGIAGIAAWLTVRIGLAWVASARGGSRGRGTRAALALPVLLILGLLGALALYASGAWQPLLEAYRHTAEFNRGDAGNVLYYHLWYLLYYPTLWPLIAVLVIMAIAWRPGPAWFAATIFLVAIVLSSFAGSKNLRYVVYAQPYAFALFGIAIASVWGPLVRFSTELRGRFASTLPFPEPTARRLANAASIVALGVLLLGNSATVRTLSLLADIEIPPEEKSVRWRAAESALRPLLERSDVVVTMTELEMLYYFDRYDILLSSSRLGEIPEGVDFSADFRTGRPVIGSVEAMGKVLECYDSGVLVTNTRRWGGTKFVSAEMARLIERSTEAVPLPKESRVLAFEWRRDDAPATEPAYCDSLPPLSGG